MVNTFVLNYLLINIINVCNRYKINFVSNKSKH